MSKKLDIEQIFNQRSRLAMRKVAFAVEDIPLDRIMPSKWNIYEIREIEALAADVETRGLEHNIVIREANADGKHEIISGERRYQAFRHLLGQGKTQYSAIPCKICAKESDAMARLSLLMDNATTRVLNDAELAAQAGALKEVLEALKEDGGELPGRVRACVADLMRLSSAHVGNLQKIDKDLSPGLKEVLAEGGMGVKEARALANLPPVRQAEVLEAYRDEGKQAIRSATRKPRQERQPMQAPALPSAARQAAEELRAIAFDIEMGAALEDERIWAACLAAADLLERRGH